MAKSSNGQPPAAEWISPKQLKPWKGNPRKNDGEPVERVIGSIKRFGFGAPIVARRENMEIIAGHTRWKAAVKLRLETVPVRLLDISERDAHMLALADNRLVELTRWDESLASVLQQFEPAEVESLGWTSADIDALAKELAGEVEPDIEDNAETPDPPSDPVTKPGVIWKLGEHRLVCGDCRDSEVVKAAVAGRLVNVAFTSPPYASQRKYDESSGFKPIAPTAFVEWFDAVQAGVREVLAPDGSWFVNIKEHAEDGVRDLYVKDLTIAHVRNWGWQFVDELCWVKQGVPGGWPNRFKNAWEPVFHYARSKAIKFRPEHVSHESSKAFDYSATNKKSSSGSGLLGAGNERASRNGMARPSNVIEVPTTSSTVVEHSAAFPIQLPSFFIRAYSDPGDHVLDPFMGSGTTLMAAEKLGRVALGCEISPGYCDVIIQRWESLTGGKAVRLNAG